MVCGPRARGLLAGLAAHSFLSLDAAPRPPLDWCWQRPATPPAGRCPAAARGHWRTPGGVPAKPRRLGRHRAGGRGCRSVAAGPPGAAGRDAAAGAAPGRASAGRVLSAAAAAISLRAGRLQDRLGPGGPDPLARGRVPPRRHGAPGRHAGGDRRRGGPGGPRRAPRAPVRPPGPAEPVRSDARPGRQAHRLGVLPRPQRLDDGHDRADRAAGGAVRPGLWRADPRPAHADGRRS